MKLLSIFGPQFLLDNMNSLYLTVSSLSPSTYVSYLMRELEKYMLPQSELYTLQNESRNLQDTKLVVNITISFLVSSKRRYLFFHNFQNC
jgi:hypothetical protein